MSTNITPSLSIVMPAYNEDYHICDNLLLTSKTLKGITDVYEIICINDGSTDNTLYEINNAISSDDYIKSITYSENKGKGYAIKKGIEEARYEYIAFIDSDLDISPDHIQVFLNKLIAENADIAIGSKMHKGSHIDYPLSRKILSYGYYLILRILFRLKLKDTQTGIKLYKSEIIKPIASDTVTNGFAFDIEMLAIAQSKGYKIIELPIDLVFTRGKQNGLSRIKFNNIVKMFRNTIAVKRRLKRKKL